jgi:LacI family transcriptional regulator
MSVTTGEIAKICGVSRGTVDRALHGRPGISPETRKKIIETAQKLGYRTNFVARSLVKGETKTLGVVAFDLYNRFFAQMVNAIEFRARELGYFIYLTLTNKDAEIEKKCIEHLVDRRVDGMLLCSVNNSYDYDKSFFKLYLYMLVRCFFTLSVSSISPIPHILAIHAPIIPSERHPFPY